MIAEPVNDHDCLWKLSQVAAEGVARRDVADLAERFATTSELAAWIRTLPQRDDHGEPSDGPKVACDVPQRARIAPPDPNCAERSLLYLAVGEVIDSGPVRQLATIDTRGGRHTFPVEDGEPVMLDPQAATRNMLAAGLHLIGGGQRNAARLGADPRALLRWLAQLAEEPAAAREGAAGLAVVEVGRRAFGRVLSGRSVSRDERRAMGAVLELAAPEAALFGVDGDRAIRIARRGIATLLHAVRSLSVKASKRLGAIVPPSAARPAVDAARLAGYGFAAFYGGPAGVGAYHQLVGAPASSTRNAPALPLSFAAFATKR